MNRISRHKILLAGRSFSHCQQQVHRFFDLTSLVIYDCIEVSEEKSFSGADTDFFQKIRYAERKNRKLVQGLIAELAKDGVHSLEDLQEVRQGYQSKTVHILSHLLDGFVGIDSYFYNLLDDSHWLPEDRARAIQIDPARHWLLHVDGFADTTENAGLLHRK